ncbi:hypothetical protein AVEN_185728-1 [Araneus ventricosus]|uniref:Uncharacterized protein n=1 Tax=Araneus ventricosus TaxID=182803 RepID=A0A4Y2I1B9_ARAVE|nr:hypothetical protein AVEN_185728-1 [Araneus ventricosus]
MKRIYHKLRLKDKLGGLVVRSDLRAGRFQVRNDSTEETPRKRVCMLNPEAVWGEEGTAQCRPRHLTRFQVRGPSPNSPRVASKPDVV